MNLTTLAAYVILDLLDSKQIIDKALAILEGGSNSTTIAYLAGESEIIYEDAKKQLIEFFTEENIEMPTIDQSKKIVLKDVFSKMINKEIPIQEGVKFIVNKLQDLDLDDKTAGDFLSIEDIVAAYFEIEELKAGATLMSTEEKNRILVKLENFILNFANNYLKANQ